MTVVIGTKNFPEEFILGQLYKQALEAKGFSVSYKENIGSTEIVQSALRSAAAISVAVCPPAPAYAIASATEIEYGEKKRLLPGAPAAATADNLHRIDPAIVKQQVEAAGFKFVPYPAAGE